MRRIIVYQGIIDLFLGKITEGKMDLKSRLAKSIRLFPFMLPIVFMLLFFGYATPKFNVTLYTDNIEGEGLGF